MRTSPLERIKLAFIYWLARRLPDCKTITPKLSESIDRKLGIWTRLIMKLHMFTCGPCRRYLHQIQFIKEAMHKADDRLRSDRHVRAELSKEARDRIKRILHAEMNVT